MRKHGAAFDGAGAQAAPAGAAQALARREAREAPVRDEVRI